MSLLREEPGRVIVGDAALALALGGVMVAGSLGAEHAWVPLLRPLDHLAWALIALTATAVLLRRVQPEAALALAAGSLACYLALAYAFGPIFFGLAVCGYTVAAHRSLRAASTAAGITAVALLAGHLAAAATTGGFTGRLMPLLLCESGAVLAPWAVGTAMRAYRDSHARSRREQAQRRVDQQRLLIAQEVHDIVGHGLSVMNMRAGIALHVFDKHPEEARQALEAIKRTSKESLEELRGTLAVFRGDPDSGRDHTTSRTPAPGLADVDVLVKTTTDGGLPVELSTTGTRARVPAAVDLAAYRIVQESLTNVVRHAHAGHARVAVDYGATQLRLDVTDDGAVRAATDHGDGHGGGGDEHAGHGIAGMRTRAAAVGGTLTAGPRREGGFQVSARLPLRELP